MTTTTSPGDVLAAVRSGEAAAFWAEAELLACELARASSFDEEEDLSLAMDTVLDHAAAAAGIELGGPGWQELHHELAYLVCRESER